MSNGAGDIDDFKDLVYANYRTACPELDRAAAYKIIEQAFQDIEALFDKFQISPLELHRQFEAMPPNWAAINPARYLQVLYAAVHLIPDMKTKLREHHYSMGCEAPMAGLKATIQIRYMMTLPDLGWDDAVAQVEEIFTDAAARFPEFESKALDMWMAAQGLPPNFFWCSLPEYVEALYRVAMSSSFFHPQSPPGSKRPVPAMPDDLVTQLIQ